MKDSITTESSFNVYLPLISNIMLQPGLYGQVRQSGVPVPHALVELRKVIYSDGEWDYNLITQTYTDVNGSYRFSSLNTLGNYERYQIKYLNDSRTPGRLWQFTCWNILSYVAGTNQPACSFDIADVSLNTPNEQIISLPFVFYWTSSSTNIY